MSEQKNKSKIEIPININSNSRTQSKQKLSWINPTSHYIYEGMMHFFDKFYDFSMYDEAYVNIKVGKYTQIDHYCGFTIFGTGFNFLKNKKGIFNETKNGIVIAGEFTTFDLALWYYFKKNAIYYSEFFFRPYHETFNRKLLFTLILIPFLHKKYIVPTIKAYDTFRKYTKKVLYFPPFFYGKTKYNTNLSQPKTKILLIGYVDDWKKNFHFFIDAINEANKRGLLKNVELHIAGASRYGDLSVTKKANIPCTYHGKLTHEQISKLYSSVNVFALPSLIDPIGAVAMEAMAHGLPLIVSKNVGSADYTDDKGSIKIDPINKEQCIQAIVKMQNHKFRKIAGDHNKETIDKNHAFFNKDLLKLRKEQLQRFIEL